MTPRLDQLVLLVDDNEHERKIFSTYLEFVGCTIITAEDGVDGLRLAEEVRPGMILLDLSMPRMDGWEMMKRLQESQALRRIPVIALTASHLEGDQVEEAGFCGYLGKPLAPYRVLEELERCLGPVSDRRTADRFQNDKRLN